MYSDPPMSETDDAMRSDYMQPQHELMNQRALDAQQQLRAEKRKKMREKKKLKKMQLSEGGAYPGRRMNPVGPEPSLPGVLSYEAKAILQQYVPPDVLSKIWLSGLAGLGNSMLGPPMYARAQQVQESEQKPDFLSPATNDKGAVNESGAAPKPKKALDTSKMKKRKLEESTLHDRLLRKKKILNMSPEKIAALTLVITPENIFSKITHQSAEHIRAHLEGLIFARSLDEQRIKVKTFNFSFGRISLLCADEFTFNWLKSNVGEIPMKDGSKGQYRGMAMHEVPKMTKYTMLVVDGHHCNVDQIFSELKRNYGIQDEWIWFASVWNNKKGKVFKFGMTPEAVGCLEVDNMCPYIGLGQYVITRIGEDTEEVAEGDHISVDAEFTDQSALISAN